MTNTRACGKLHASFARRQRRAPHRAEHFELYSCPPDPSRICHSCTCHSSITLLCINTQGRYLRPALHAHTSQGILRCTLTSVRASCREVQDVYEHQARAPYASCVHTCRRVTAACSEDSRQRYSRQHLRSSCSSRCTTSACITCRHSRAMLAARAVPITLFTLACNPVHTCNTMITFG